MVGKITNRYADVSETADTLINTSRFHLTKGFIQHGKISVYSHCFSVAVMSIRIANFLDIKVDKKALIRGALLHDYFLYDWHDKPYSDLHGYRHPARAAEKEVARAAAEAEKKRLGLYVLRTRFVPLGKLCFADDFVAVLLRSLLKFGQAFQSLQVKGRALVADEANFQRKINYPQRN